MAATRESGRPRLPSVVYRDLKGAAGTQLDAVASAYAEAGEAMQDGATGRAVELLMDAKRRASRSWAVREALGIAFYLEGRFKDAARELGAYRRMSGRPDQNHLLADCARANDQLDRAEDLVDEMVRGGVPADRVAEGLLVIAGARADGGDPDAALAVLHRVDLAPAVVEPHHLRLWYLAADLEERRDDPAAAAGYLTAIATVDPDFLDVATRLAAMEDGSDAAQEGSGASADRVRQ